MNDEFLAMQSIFEDDFKQVSEKECMLDIQLSDLTDYKIFFSSNLPPISVTYLPPLICKFNIPDGYPERVNCLLSISCVWMSQEQRDLLTREALKVWSCGDFCLFSIADQLQSSTLQVLGIGSKLDISDFPNSETIANAILKHDIMKKRTKFEHETFFCGVCFENFKGCKCFRFSACSHVFCTECLAGYLSSSIKSYQRRLACPHPDCVMKSDDDETIGIEQLTEILKKHLPDREVEELVNRFNQLQRVYLNTSDKMSTCPACEYLNAKDPEESLTICAQCKYPFCNKCHSLWHGIDPCTLGKAGVTLTLDGKPLSFTNADLKKIMADYSNPDLPLEERRVIEFKLGGKERAERLVQCIHEELETQKLMKTITKPCPACNTRIEKHSGCNHMTCPLCGTHFCWICSRFLNKNDPYYHFNGEQGGICFQKLFDETTINADDFPLYDDQEEFWIDEHGNLHNLAIE